MNALLYFLLQLFKILPNSSSPSPPNFASAVNFWSLVCLTEWVIMPHLMCYFSFDDIMVLYMSCFGTLVPERPCYMFDATRNQVYWGLTHNVIFSGTMIWYHKHIYTQRYTAHSGANRLTHPYKYISTSPGICSQQVSVLHELIPWY